MKNRIWQIVLLLAALAVGAGISGGARAQQNYDAFDRKAFYKTFSHHTANVNGVTIHYVTGGTGEPLLLVHGYPQTWWEWHKVMPALAAHYRVIAVDMRGMGDSSVPETGYDKKTVAEDIYQTLKQMGIMQYSVIGHDWGGAVTYALVAAHPEQVRRYVFIESALPGYGLEGAEDITHGGSFHFGFFREPEIPEMLTAGRERQFLTTFAYRGKFIYRKEAITDADISEYVKHYAAPGRMKAGFEYYRAIPQDTLDVAESAKNKLPMPVLAIGGDKSFGELPRKCMEGVAANVRGVIIKDSGHFVAEEQPEAFLREVMAFLAETTP